MMKSINHPLRKKNNDRGRTFGGGVIVKNPHKATTVGKFRDKTLGLR